MVKHTQKIRRQTAEELLECVWPFCGVGAQRFKNANNKFTEALEDQENIESSNNLPKNV